MFKTAAAKIAHNSTLPALGGNQDLRPLQDLITAEKAVLISLQKLSVDYSKASEALRTWGLNEGDDLGDILSASTTLLNHFSSALSQYATHGHAMRDQLKAIRTREEALEDLKRRRRTVVRKAEDAEKKLSKMSPEHKNLGMQTETLNRLRDEIRTMDSDIMTEEAALGDFKRSATRTWVGLKFGGLLECCEKGSIAAEFGKMLISEISEEMTQPGLPRSLYYGQPKSENLVAEASRCIGEVVLSTVPSLGSRDRRQYDQSLPPPQGEYAPNNDGHSPSPWNEGKPQPPPPMQLNTDYLGNSQRTFGDNLGSPTATSGPSFTSQPYSPIDQQPYSGSGFSQRMLPEIQGESPEKSAHSVDDFGMNARTPGLIDSSNASGGRFATFPVKTRAAGANGGYSLQDPPSINSRQQDQSFSASIAEALDDRESQETGQATEGTHNHAQQPPYAERGPTGQVPWTGRGQASYEFAAPPATNNELPPIPGAASSSLPPPPPGAALPNLASPWDDSNREGSVPVPTHSHLSVNEDALLAYMTSAQDDLHVDDEPSSPAASTLVAPSQSEEEQQRISRHVRFGEVEDVEEQMEKKRSLEKERQEHGPNLGDKTASEFLPPQNVTGVDEGHRSESSSPNSKPSSHRVPPPTIFSDIDEQALDAAAARDVARELDALKVNQPSPPDLEKRSETEPADAPDRGRLPTTIHGQSEQTMERDHSPLSPPHAPFAGRSVSPHPYAELNPNVPPPAPYGGRYSPSQSYQDSGSYGSSLNASAGQAYAQPYQSSPTYSQPTTPDSGHAISSSLPPRFQALNRSSENQVPPRFQSTQSAAHQQQLPPRFQAGGASQVPSAISLPEQQDPARFASSLKTSEGSTPYRTPPEYPRSLGVTPGFTRSSSSLNASSSPGSTPISGPRTISAAAFKRPRNTSTDNMGTSGEFVKKSLPSSPYPLRDQGERGGNPIPSTTTTTTATKTSSAPPVLPPIDNTPQTDLDDDYDYISAYVNSSNPNSPTQGEFSIAATSSGQGGTHPGRAGGYGEGRFATDLEEDVLR